MTVHPSINVGESILKLFDVFLFFLTLVFGLLKFFSFCKLLLSFAFGSYIYLVFSQKALFIFQMITSVS